MILFRLLIYLSTYNLVCLHSCLDAAPTISVPVQVLINTQLWWLAIVCKSVQWGGGCGSTTNHESFSCTQSASARHSSPRGWCDWVCTPNNRTPICQCHYAMHLLLLSTQHCKESLQSCTIHNRDRQSEIDGSSCPIDRTSHLFSDEQQTDTALDGVWWGWMGGQKTTTTDHKIRYWGCCLCATGERDWRWKNYHK